MLFVQALLADLKKKAAEAEEQFAQAKKESDERLKRAEQAEAKITETQEALQRYLLPWDCWFWLHTTIGPKIILFSYFSGYGFRL